MKRIAAPGRLKLAVLASGRGSNFLAIQESIKRGELNADICIVISDKKDALALDKARDEGISAVCIEPVRYSSKDEYEMEIVRELQNKDVDLVVLAGYMRLVGKEFLKAYPHRIVNIHPALLPSFQGLHAQRQAVDYGVKYSGCTVHLVDDGMDTGPIILQTVVPVYDSDTEDSLSERILIQEHKIYSQALQYIAEGKAYIDGRKIIIDNN